MATGYIGKSGTWTYFNSGPVSLNVTMPANVYPNGSFRLENLGQGQAYFHNSNNQNRTVAVYLCDANGNNSVKLYDMTIAANGDTYYPNSATVSGAQGLAGKALYMKFTGAEIAVKNIRLRNRTNVTVNTANLSNTITCSAGTGGSLSANVAKAAPGTTVTLTPNPDTGYQLSGYTSSPAVTITNNKFTMPNSAVTITASFSKINYTITKVSSPAGGGTITADATATYGSSVSISQVPATGYYFTGWTISPAVTISGGAFTMPASNVTLTANYKLRSTATLSGSTLTGGGTTTLNISAESSAYTHKYKLSFGTNMETSLTDVAAGVSSVELNIPESWSNYIPNAATKTGGTLLLETYSGETKIGEYTITDLTYAVPAGAVPVIGDVVTSIARTIGQTTYANVGNYYVQNHCGVEVETDAEGALSSTIASIRVALNGYTGSDYDTTVYDDEIDFTTGLLTMIGSTTITVTATDSRGRTATKTATISVVEYNAPAGNLSVKRVDLNGDDDDTGVYAKYTLSKSYTAVGSNSLTVTLTSQGSDEVISLDTGDILPSSRQTFSTQQEYMITATLQDAFETTVLQVKLRSAKFIIYVTADGNKLGIMKAANKTIPAGKNATFEISGDAQIYIGDDTLEDYIRAIVQNM